MANGQSYKQARKLGLDSGLVLAGNIMDKLFGLVFAVGIAKLYGLKVFGLFLLGVNICQLGSLTINFGFGKGLVRFVSLFDEQQDEARLKGVIRTMLVLSLPLALLTGMVLFLGADSIVGQFFDNKFRLALVLKCFAITLPLSALTSIWLRSLVGLKIFKPQMVVYSIIEPAVKVGIALVCFALGFKIEGLIIAYLMATIVAVIVAHSYYSKALSARLKSVEPIFQFGELLRFSWPLLLRNLVSKASRRADVLLLGAFRGPIEVALYTFALRLSTVGTFITDAFQKAYTPHIPALHAGGKHDDLRRTFQMIAKWTMLLTAPIFAMLIFFPEAIIPVLGEQFMSAAIAVSVITTAIWFNYAVGPSETAIMMVGRPRTALLIRLIGGVVALGLNIWLTPRYGLIGAAWAFTGSALVTNLLAASIAYRDMNLHPLRSGYLKTLAAGFIAAAVGAALHPLLPDNKYLSLLLLGAAMLGAYGGSLLLLGLDQQDKDILRRGRGRVESMLARRRVDRLADAKSTSSE